jgi:hypothetical protein
MTEPNVLKSTDQGFVSRMAMMMKLHRAFVPNGESDFPSQIQQRRFASQLAKPFDIEPASVCFECLTEGTTTIFQTLLCHMDTENDVQQGFDMVNVAFKIVMQAGVWY